jgi:plastocyanin
MSKRIWIVVLAIATIAIPASALAQIDGGGSARSRGVAGLAAGTHTVVLKGRRFHPSTLAIRRGESVTWAWEDGQIEHNVTAPGFRSRTQTHGSFMVRFTHAGTFNYRCTIHAAEGMVGKVIVH